MSQPLLPNPSGLRLRGRDRLGHAGVKVKWEPVEARHGVNAQADAQQGIPDWIRCYPTPP